MAGLQRSFARARYLSAAAIALSGWAAANGVFAADAAGFFDGFDKLDAARWYVSDGWSNGPHQNCGWSNKEVTVKDGMLDVGFSKNPAAEGRIYRCGELQTKTALSYGTFEARLKTPTGSGLDSAFFTYIGAAQKMPHDEIDLEFLPKDPLRVHTTTFVDDKSGNGNETPLPGPANAGFVDYAMVWSPDKVEFYADHKLIRTIEGPGQVPTHPQRLYFSLWGTDTLTDWMGPFKDPGAPIAMQVDWVGYTPAGAHCLFPESMTCP